MGLRLMLCLSASLCLCGFSRAQPPEAGKYFMIRVVDEQTGRGVPLVELKTTHNVRYHTDSAGLVAFYEPGLMNTEVYFHIKSHGYEYPKDGFGYAGKALRLTAGGSAEIKIKRVNIAERLYRVTGGGIYHDSVLLGRPVPIEQPVINGLVFGSDSVQTTIYRGKLFWIWGDTSWPAYPLGNFHATAATSRLPADGGLDPEVGVNLSYLVGKGGFAKGMAPIGPEGAVWLDGLVTLRDPNEQEQMLAAFARVRSLTEILERGFVQFDDHKQEFVKVGSFPVDAPTYPMGHPFRVQLGGQEYFYFAQALPLWRVRADREDYLDIGRCESYTCLKEGSKLDEPRIDRDERGAIRYTWRRNTPVVGCKEQTDLVKSGHLKPEEALIQTRDIETGKPVMIHSGSVYWNAYRGRWVMIAAELSGTSMLGETWYFEADTPVGPWVYGRKIVTHEQYSFYNPKQHPQFDKEGGRVIFFEGTYTELFSGNPAPTPLYDYNQIMYKLDLGDERLVLPVPVYDVSTAGVPNRFATLHGLPPGAESPPVAFLACDRSGPGLVPVYAAGAAGGERLSAGAAANVPSASAPTAVFYAVPPDGDPNRSGLLALHEFASADGRQRAYSVDVAWSRPGWTRAEKPLCYVWSNPLAPSIRFAPLEAKPR